MKDEIKEILDINIDDDREAYINYIDKDGKRKSYEYIEAEDLLDYITNLQEENERYRTANSTLSEAENFMYNQAKDYKTRNEKAIERATHIQKIYGYELSDLIFLLQGSDS